ncbi:MAG: hypothetical protein GXY33_04750 [Phycisphaerae bacterium]|nr:hypothetical protein [Phycisphaerae bacterium]
MLSRVYPLLLLLVVGVLVVGMVGCNGGIVDPNTTDPNTTDPNTSDPNTTDPNTTDPNTTDPNTTDPNTAELTIVKTSIAMRHDADIEAGDDLIAYGTDTLVGVSYMVPSEGESSAKAVTNSEKFDSSGFAVGGKTIFLAGSNTADLMFQVAVFDTETETLTVIDPNEIYLNSIPVSADDTGNIQADGDYCIVICNQNEVADGAIIKVIDVSGETPVVVSLPNPDGVDYAGGVDMVQVDAESMKAVAVADGKITIYDLENPQAAPIVAAPVNEAGGDVQVEMDQGYLIGLDDQSYPQAFLVNLDDGNVITMTDAEATFDVAIAGAAYAFFADYDADDSMGGSQRTAVGSVPNPAFTKVAREDYIDGSTNNNGWVGYAGSMDVAAEGDYIFLADSYLQYSTGGPSFTVPADPDGEDTYGCPAWDVDCTINTVAFKTAETRSDNTTVTVGYIALP